MKYPNIAKKLSIMAKLDKETRNKLELKNINKEIAWNNIEKIDKKYTKKLKEIISHIGLPTVSMVGKKGSLNAWLIVQHSGMSELNFMKKYLKMMEYNMNDIIPYTYAYLIDRIYMLEKKPQIYGTQFIEKNEKIKPYLIYDIKNVDKRRKQVGLNTFKETKKEIGAV